MPIVQDLLYDARALVDEYNENGDIISPDSVATIEANGLRFINMALQEVYSKTRTYVTHTITRKPIKSLIGDNFQMLDFEGEDTIFAVDGVVGAKSYYFEVDNDAIIYIEEWNGVVWNVIDTIDTTGTTELTDFRGQITATSSLFPIRIRFSGTTYYRYKNVALFSQPFKTADIPDYKAFVQVTLPNDFGELDKVVAEYAPDEYDVANLYKWEGYNTLVVNYNFEGELRVIYNPIPVVLTTFNDTVPVNNPIAIQFITFYTAAKIATTENPQIANFFEQKANELRFEANKGQPATEQRILDVYYGEYHRR